MKQDELDAITAEVQDSGSPAKNPKQTFMFKWLNRAYKLVMLFDLFAFLVFVVQAVLFIVFPEKELIIPGQIAIYTGAGLVTAAFVGGEEIAGKFQQQGGK